MGKIRVGLLFGGTTAEHEVSLMSAKSIYENIDYNKYEVVLLGVDKKGVWHLGDKEHFLINDKDPKQIALNVSKESLALSPGSKNKAMFVPNSPSGLDHIDVIFSVMHGTIGEDGSMQGLLRTLGIPFVGPGVLASSVGMDKDVTKRLLREAKIPVAKSMLVRSHEKEGLNYSNIALALGTPIFVKPANTGSSVGISKVKSEKDFSKAIEEAFLYDHKVLIEEAVVGREIEISVMGNEQPIASVPGEIVTKHEFYSYEAKYIDESGSYSEIPAKIDEATTKKVKDMAIHAYQVLCCEGMARVDFFLKENGDLLINEINTLPGFTKISMYPKMWEAAGVSYKDLLDRLIQYSLERHTKDKKIKLSP